ncbi:GNAT family N-acetyltransferase [Dethiothermospora halolimnae]|uniref:GNAT family N-acetyltransferase n=1 Tax=Dethiothermospora halolimnae TaxID=3114390 RepID=UPI003CCBA115
MIFELVSANKKHCDLLFQWVNNDLVRKNSFNTKNIEYKDHKNWFVSKILSKYCHIYILYLKDIAIGQVRIDIKDKKGIIDYSIDEKYRGNNYGVVLLNLLKGKVSREGIDINMLLGSVKKQNIASQKVFEKCGYSKVIKDDYINYYYEI